MRGHNICFYWEIRKIIFELSLIPSLIWSFVLVQSNIVNVENSKKLHGNGDNCIENCNFGK